MGLTARKYPIAAATAITAGEVVKLVNGLVVASAAAAAAAILGVAAENHPGTADALNPRANGKEILVYDNPELIFECPVSEITAASGSATTIVPANGDVDASSANDAFNNSVLVLVNKAGTNLYGIEHFAASHADQITFGYVFGGPAAVNEGVASSFAGVIS